MADKKTVPLEQLKAARDIVAKYQTGDFRKLLGKVPENEKKVIEQALEDIKDKDLKNNYWEWAGYITDSDNSPAPAEDKLDHEVVNDFAIDAIKDEHTPPGAKGEKKMNKRMFAPDMLCPKCKEPMLYQAGGGRIKCSKCGNEVGEDTLDSLELYKSPNIEESEQLKDAIDTNDNGKIEVDEMADFQKSLDDYAAKNKKGRDDIPVTTRR